MLLIAAKANINTADSRGITPLEDVVEMNNVELLRLLLSMGVNGNVVRKDTGSSALIDACTVSTIESRNPSLRGILLFSTPSLRASVNFKPIAVRLA